MTLNISRFFFKISHNIIYSYKNIISSFFDIISFIFRVIENCKLYYFTNFHVSVEFQNF